ncbi:MAG TPA: hypothetical protein VFM37_09000, partial [Pseudonocardiaceae bacterium]|nr:hypothetical protein [Pseudonocardiaceae bacterium]
MSLERLWSAHGEGASPDELRASAGTGHECFYLAVLAYGRGERAVAADLAGRASKDDPDRVVYAETARYLRDGG